MKKLYLAIAILALAATLVTGCGNNDGATRADSRTETSSNVDGGAYSYNESGSDDSYDSSKEYNSGDENGSYVPPKVGGSRDKSGPNLAEIFKGKPKVDVEDYIRYSYSQEDINKENPRRGYFNLEGYLYAYGATEIKYLGVSKGGMAYGVRFKNGIILGMLFIRIKHMMNTIGITTFIILSSLQVHRSMNLLIMTLSTMLRQKVLKVRHHGRDCFM